MSTFQGGVDETTGRPHDPWIGDVVHYATDWSPCVAALVTAQRSADPSVVDLFPVGDRAVIGITHDVPFDARAGVGTWHYPHQGTLTRDTVGTVNEPPTLAPSTPGGRILTSDELTLAPITRFEDTPLEPLSPPTPLESSPPEIL